jgi:hypothetical protein
MERTSRVPIELPAEIAAATRALIKSFWAYGKLEPQLRELLRMRSAVLANCVF